jgi:uncharacterized membrane protein (UPF0127 family)
MNRNLPAAPNGSMLSANIRAYSRCRTNIFLMAASIFLFSALVFAEMCPKKLPSASVSIKGITLHVEVAATAAARACGLSHRQRLSHDQGMLFVHPVPMPLVFWMKDTFIPLSIAFIDATGRIVSIQDMTPIQTDEKYRSPIPAPYAIEVNQGWFVEQKIQVGDTVEIRLPMGLNIR